MGYLFFYLFNVFVSFWSGNEPGNCDNFHDGTFVLDTEPSGPRFYIERNGSMQIEHMANNDTTIEFEVKWIRPCEYELRRKCLRLKTPDGPPEGIVLQKLSRHPVLKVRIVESTEEYYIFKMRNFDGMMLSDTIRRIGGFKSMSATFPQ